jgi:hypothetical protein
MSIQAVSNLIGAIEIIIAVLLVFSAKFAVLRRYAGIGMTITFMVTLSYLFTSGNMESGRRYTCNRLFYLKRPDAFRIWINDFTKQEIMNKKVNMKNILIVLGIILGIAVFAAESGLFKRISLLKRT